MKTALEEFIVKKRRKGLQTHIHHGVVECMYEGQKEQRRDENYN